MMKKDVIITNSVRKFSRSSKIKTLLESKRLKTSGERNTKTNKIVMLTTFPPRECGIATYSQDLFESLNNAFGESFTIKICRLYDSKHTLNPIDKGEFVLETNDKRSYQKLTHQINDDQTIKLVMIQHEFGLFNGCNTIFIDFLKSLKTPIIVGFHTVIPSPTPKLLAHIKAISDHVAGITVMTQTSKNIMTETYGIKASKIEVITHGTHLIKYKNISKLKRKYGLQGKTVLSTFGFLGPGKNIETTLNALPEIVQQFPNIKFLIMGKTHPILMKNEGEAYRNSLIDKVKALHLEDHVVFINEFLPLNNLLEYLQLTDIYIFSSKDPHQAVSGTFSYAMSCGCPIISTPIPHAKEVLSENNGLLFDFGDSVILTKQLKRLLNDKAYRESLGRHALHTSLATSWQNSALQHGQLFHKYDADIQLKYNKPTLKFDHLKKMTTDIGIIQFAKLNEPDFKSGYTLDDNARALIVACHNYKYTGDALLLKHLKIYLKFILSCQRSNGKFLNYVDENEQFTNQNDEVDLQDSNGRAIWALGEFISLEHQLPAEWAMCFHKATECINDFLSTIDHVKFPRAMAFIIKGLQPSSKPATHPLYISAMTTFGTQLLNKYETESEGNWKWFEPDLTYGNSVLPEALLKCYQLTKIEAYKTAALESFQFLLAHIFQDHQLKVISNKSWFSKGDDIQKIAVGGQQPIDVAYTIIALKNFNDEFPNEDYENKMQLAFEWFLGNNHLNQIIYNPCTAGCFDGLETSNVNLNQGAESTVSYLLARLVFEEKAYVN